MTKDTERRPYRKVEHRRGFNTIYRIDGKSSSGEKLNFVDPTDGSKGYERRVQAINKDNIDLSKDIYDYDDDQIVQMSSDRLINEMIRFWNDLNLTTRNTSPDDLLGVTKSGAIGDISFLGDLETRELDVLEFALDDDDHYIRALRRIKQYSKDNNIAFAPGIVINYLHLMKYMTTPVDVDGKMAQAPLRELLDVYYLGSDFLADDKEYDKTKKEIQTFFYKNGLESLLQDEKIKLHIQGNNGMSDSFFENISKDIVLSSGVAFAFSDEWSQSPHGDEINLSIDTNDDKFHHEIFKLKDRYRDAMNMKERMLNVLSDRNKKTDEQLDKEFESSVIDMETQFNEFMEELDSNNAYRQQIARNITGDFDTQGMAMYFVYGKYADEFQDIIEAEREHLKQMQFITEQQIESELRETEKIKKELDFAQRVDNSVLKNVELSKEDKKELIERKKKLKKIKREREVREILNEPNRYSLDKIIDIDEIKLQSKLRIKKEMKSILEKRKQELAEKKASLEAEEANQIATGIEMLEQYVNQYSQDIKQQQQKRRAKIEMDRIGRLTDKNVQKQKDTKIRQRL